MRRRGWLALGVLTVLPPVLTASGTPRATAGAPDAVWLDVVNAYRTSAGLPTITDNPALQPALTRHVLYMARSGFLTHGESPTVAGYTADGDVAGQQSLLAGWQGTDKTDRELVEGWLTAPIHLVHLLEPRLRSGGFASVHNLQGGVFDAAAALNVVAGVGPKVAVDRPIVFPGDGSTVPLTTFITESPNPLVACPGYKAPAGMGIVAMFPSAPGKVTTTITSGGEAVEHCVIDVGFVSPEAGEQATVRAILGQKNAVVLIPRKPLTPGATYEVAVNGAQSVSWRFRVLAEGSELPTAGSPVTVRKAKR